MRAPKGGRLWRKRDRADEGGPGGRLRSAEKLQGRHAGLLAEIGVDQLIVARVQKLSFATNQTTLMLASPKKGATNRRAPFVGLPQRECI